MKYDWYIKMDNLRNELLTVQTDVDHELEERSKTINILKKALEFYADDDSWGRNELGNKIIMNSPPDYDQFGDYGIIGGRQARTALREAFGDEND